MRPDRRERRSIIYTIKHFSRLWPRKNEFVTLARRCRGRRAARQGPHHNEYFTSLHNLLSCALKTCGGWKFRLVVCPFCFVFGKKNFGFQFRGLLAFVAQFTILQAKLTIYIFFSVTFLFLAQGHSCMLVQWCFLCVCTTVATNSFFPL